MRKGSKCFINQSEQKKSLLPLLDWPIKGFETFVASNGTHKLYSDLIYLYEIQNQENDCIKLSAKKKWYEMPKI